MLLDQQIPMEKAFSGPVVIASRMGTDGLDPGRSPRRPRRCSRRSWPARPPSTGTTATSRAASRRCARHVVDTYDGDAAAIWRGADSGDASCVPGSRRCPASATQKAKIFVALLGKQLGVRPPGWREAAGDYGTPGSHRSVADVVDGESLLKVREFKKAAKAEAKARGSRLTARRRPPRGPGHATMSS